ncbi:MAG: linear amide C-N hydrolase [Anaerolineae bacterium]|nr:linear amide C-N hydrolase [Anaerolineae bacterium]
MSATQSSQRGVGGWRAASITVIWVLVLSITACGQGGRPAVTTPGHVDSLTPETTHTAAGGLSADEVATLESLERLDDYPLYTMRYEGMYGQRRVGLRERVGAPGAVPVWGCSLFAALGDEEAMLYGRNFDWEFSPALLLFTDPPDGYASVSMVDIAYLGFGSVGAGSVDALPLDEMAALLDAPLIPFDGMNEHGLVVGMAAVPAGNVQPDPQKPTIGSLGIIREMLDHARTADEALAILESYNVDMEGGPPVHYLVADSTGRALLIEFFDGALRVLPNETAWHQATNFLRASVAGNAQSQCTRYDRLAERLSVAGGRLAVPEAIALLSDVSQPGTQWSVVYGLQSGQIDVVMGREYGSVHTLALKMAAAPPTSTSQGDGPGALSGRGDVARELLTRDEWSTSRRSISSWCRLAATWRRYGAGW